MDLCSEEAVVHAEAGIRAINSSVHIVRTKHCAVDWTLLLNRHGYKHGAAIELPPIAEVSASADVQCPVRLGGWARLQAWCCGGAAACRGGGMRACVEHSMRACEESCHPMQRYNESLPVCSLSAVLR